jgi:hypothetical protein
MPRHNPELVATLEHWLAAARKGELKDNLYLLARQPDGEYAEECVADDIDDLALQLRTGVIRIQLGL